MLKAKGLTMAIDLVGVPGESGNRQAGGKSPNALC
jgi:hypothetical protein